MPEIRRDTNRMSHGVTMLTYVGDDEALESATKPAVTLSPLAIGGIAALLFGRGMVRLAGAAVLGYAWLKR